jgi:hypothetical protein
MLNVMSRWVPTMIDPKFTLDGVIWHSGSQLPQGGQHPDKISRNARAAGHTPLWNLLMI